MTAPVETRSGRVRGRAVGDLLRFDGIPFAAPPIGPLRLAPPAPPRPWAGVLEADRPPPAPLQRPGDPLGSRPVTDTSEDCLYLNLVTPGCDDRRRPVMVWVHGGGFVNGSAADPLYAGERLARRGDLVLVTFNYRLGLFGFCHHDGASNVGMLDQVAALGWVRENIAAFGGDPDRVTLFGESAGAMSLFVLGAMPSAAPLYHRVIAQSGACTGTLSGDQAAEVTDRLQRALGAPVADWTGIDAGRLLDAQVRVAAEIRRSRRHGAFRPVIDGDLVTRHPLQALTDDGNRDRPLLIGTNADEQRLFVNLRHALSREDAIDRLATWLPDAPDLRERLERLLTDWARREPDAGEALRLAAAETELLYRLPVLRVLRERADAGATAQWNYLFRRRSPALRGRLGACHALEIPFVFGTLDAPGMERFAGNDPEAWALSELMIDHWSAFAADGRLQAWPAWEPGKRMAMIYDDVPAPTAAPAEAARQAWLDALPDLVC